MPRIVIALLLWALMGTPSQGQTAPPHSAVPGGTPGATPAARLRTGTEVARDLSAAARFQGAGQGEPIPIAPPTAARSAPTTGGRRTTGSMALVVGSSLAIVLGLFFLFVWLSRRAFPKTAATLPSDVLEVLGRVQLASRHHLQLIRLGRRLVLISVTAEHAEALSEITDPDEVNQLCGLCRQQQPGSISDSFRQVLQQLGASPAASWPAAAGRDADAFASSDRRPRSSVS
jgi:flagellar biogenesis protein FliO